MKNTIITLKKQIANIRENIELELIIMLKYHNVTKVDCGDRATPVIFNDIEDDMITLGVIELYTSIVSGNEYILFSGCGEHKRHCISSKSMDIEYLIAVYEWVLEKQEELFDESDD